MAYNDLKSSSQKEIQSLKNSVAFERKRRVSVQEDKLEKSTALMQELVERDKRIVNLQNEVRALRDEKSDMESISRTYFGLGGGAGDPGLLRHS